MSCHQTRSLLHAQHLDFWKLIKILKSQQSKSSQWKQHRDDQSRHPLSPFDPNRSYGATVLRHLSGSGALMVGHEEQRTKPLGGWSAMVTWLKLQFGIHYYSELFRTIQLIPLLISHPSQSSPWHLCSRGCFNARDPHHSSILKGHHHISMAGRIVLDKLSESPKRSKGTDINPSAMAMA